jgi:hypothetical protein
MTEGAIPPRLDIVSEIDMKSDAQFAELSVETGSPLGVRLPFSLFGVVVNFQFFLYGWRDPLPTWVFVAFAAASVALFPAFLVQMVRLIRARGLLFGYVHPIVFSRWGWWLMIWPAREEPRWRRLFAVGTLAWVGVFSTAGFLRWGFTSY